MPETIPLSPKTKNPLGPAQSAGVCEIQTRIGVKHRFPRYETYPRARALGGPIPPEPRTLGEQKAKKVQVRVREIIKRIPSYRKVGRHARDNGEQLRRDQLIQGRGVGSVPHSRPDSSRTGLRGFVRVVLKKTANVVGSTMAEQPPIPKDFRALIRASPA